MMQVLGEIQNSFETSSGVFEEGQVKRRSFSKLPRSRSVPDINQDVSQLIKSTEDKCLLLDDFGPSGQDSGVSMKEQSSLCPSIIQEQELAQVMTVQGDFASGGSGLCPSEPPSLVDDPIQTVKQLIVTQIDKKLKDLRTLKQHYYPEGGWGWLLVLVTFLVQGIVHGAQISIGMYLNSVGEEVALNQRSTSVAGHSTISSHLVFVRRIIAGKENDSSWLGALSLSTSLFISPMTIAICRRKSTRLTAVLGGLITALACLFTSFASQFHQLFFSYGLMMGIGVGMTRDPATLMIGQYFKRKRELVEIILVSGSGLGLTVMSMFLHRSMSSIGWRLGLQAVSGVISVTFILGTFYRSASLYHPQRRAILHLKSQKRKIKNKDKEKNKAQDERPPYFDFSTLKSRTIQILLIALFVSSFGLYAPLLYLVQQAYIEGIFGPSLIYLQAYLGLAWCCGCVVFGLVVVSKSKECSISKQYLCQTALFLCGVSILAFTAVNGYNGYVMFVWIYGFFLGGFNYAMKLYIYEKVRARNFARAWGFAQCAMAIPQLLGVPIVGYLNVHIGRQVGFYVSAASVLLGAFVMCFITVHRKNLRRKKRRLRQNSRKSIGTNSLGQASNSGCGIHDAQSQLGRCHQDPASNTPSLKTLSHGRGAHPVFSGLDPRLSHSEHDNVDLMVPIVSLLSHPHSLNYDDLIDLGNPPGEASIFSEEGIADMDLPENLFLDELEYLDNITSCNKVENCLMLSEYEQNLIKETESPTPGANGARRTRKWSLFRQPSVVISSQTETPPSLGSGRRRFQNASHTHPEKEIPVFSNTNRRLPSQGPKRTITVIEEASM
ncbi:monocarboxylate transporter 2-like isoform X1 [Tigriopus californicus]|uniref:monocarboxylate transporter 2-like isoform X1 n=1 Tax=Tigriopus californicus TaxID=6832 RepID=UPI0027DA06E2|nr:monocarboxylate transporter 2-like isoform X1 [Tigriopus californicus]